MPVFILGCILQGLDDRTDEGEAIAHGQLTLYTIAIVFEIELTDQAIEDLQWFKKHEQNVIIDGIEANLCYEPTTQTRNRKRLRPNDTAEWELRLGAYRVLYNVEETVRIVSIERIAAKQGNKYIFQGEEGEL